ncbi:MAG: hypothetical protein LBV47_06855, partial [Bacteroidales bacterium]|nr:hypothetical protein [Bacteroidales bacterium]
MNKYNPNLHHRRSIRLHRYDYSQEGLYFVTVCTQNRTCLFGEITAGEMRLNETGRIVENEWIKLPERFNNVVLDIFQIMPNHFHGILQIVGAGSARPEINDSDTDNNRAGEPRPYVPALGNMIAYFKYQTTKQIDLPVKLWQRNYYEHIIR